MHILYTSTAQSDNSVTMLNQRRSPEEEGKERELTDENNMIIQLSLILALAIHLRHLLERVKHRLYDLLIRHIDAPPNLERVRVDELAFNSGNIDGERLDEGRHTVSLLARQLCVFHRFYLAVL